jgi:hypothetical protein
LTFDHLNDDEVQELLSRLKQEFEHSIAEGGHYELTNLLYKEFMEVRDELNKRIKDKNDLESNSIL